MDGSVGIIVAAHNSLCTNHIYKFGTEEQKKKYLPLAQGKKLGCWSLTEPEAGSDAGGTRTHGSDERRRLGDQRLEDVHHQRALRRRVRGHGGDGRSEEEPRNFRVHRGEGNAGIQARAKRKISWACARATPPKWFSAIAACPAENLLGKEGEGFVNSLQILDGGRISIASLGLGMAQGAYEAAVSYAKQRKQFGKAIGEFQAIQFKLADMATEIEAARLLTYQAAWLADRAIAAGEIASVDSRSESSMAKLYAGEVAVRVANEAVQIFGGYGFIKDYPAEKFYRDVKLCTIGEGTSEIQRLVIARQLLGKKLLKSDGSLLNA